MLTIVIENIKHGFLRLKTIGKALVVLVISVVLAGGANIVFGNASNDNAGDEAHILPVLVGTVHYQDNHAVRHEFTGHIVAGRSSNLGFEVGGRILHVYKDNGDEAVAGEPLAMLDLSRAEARLRSLEAQKQEISARLRLAERSLDRREETYQENHTSAQVLDEAKANESVAKAQLARIEAELEFTRVDLNASTLKAPYDGYVDRRFLDEGEIVAAGSVVLSFVEKLNYEAQVGVPNEYVAHLEVGKLVDLESEKGELIKAEVARISPAIRGDTRTQLVTLKLFEIANTSFGELVTMRLNSQRQARGFWVPMTALTADVRGLWRLYRVEDSVDGRAKIVIENVQVLHVDGARVFVTGSLNDGAKFVSVGVVKVSPNQFVEPIEAPISNQALDRE